nr:MULTISPECIES: SpoIIE family protein phosphatase [unclassified Frankia]
MVRREHTRPRPGRAGAGDHPPGRGRDGVRPGAGRRRRTDPPLAARPRQAPRPQAGTSYHADDTLVLYTDGLIERRGEDIEAGLDRLVQALLDNRALSPECLADALLDRLGVAGGARDDIGLIVVRL